MSNLLVINIFLFSLLKIFYFCSIIVFFPWLTLCSVSYHDYAKFPKIVVQRILIYNSPFFLRIGFYNPNSHSTFPFSETSPECLSPKQGESDEFDSTI